MIGQLKFKIYRGRNILSHSIEVAKLSGILAAELGEDVTLAKRAGLLHEIGRATNNETDGSHIDIGIDLAKKNIMKVVRSLILLLVKMKVKSLSILFLN